MKCKRETKNCASNNAYSIPKKLRMTFLYFNNMIVGRRVLGFYDEIVNFRLNSLSRNDMLLPNALRHLICLSEGSSILKIFAGSLKVIT